VDDVLADVAEPAVPMIEVEAVPAAPPVVATPPMAAPVKAEPPAPAPAPVAAAAEPMTPAPEPVKAESATPKADATMIETQTQTAPKAIAATTDPARSEILDIATPKPTAVLPLPRAPDDPGPPQDAAEPPEKKRFTLFGR
jgi:hypothetical protein